jgi:hypothetical protein
MKKVIMMILLALISRLTQAQDTAYISQDKTTALFFSSPVTLLGAPGKHILVNNRGNGVVTLKASRALTSLQILELQVVSTKKVYRIPVIYSYGRAGRRMEYGPSVINVALSPPPIRMEQAIARQLVQGKRSNIATHEKSGDVKAWINKISLAGKRIFLRLDFRNGSNLPYDIDFVRFYIRDRKTVDRTATHEQEIMPQYSTLGKHNAVTKGQDAARVFAFKRFSLSEDEILCIEVYERTGNRHLYLKIKPKHLSHLQVIEVPQPPALHLTSNANHIF